MTIFSSSKKTEAEAVKALLLKLAKAADNTSDPKELAPLSVQIRQCLRRLAELEDGKPDQQTQSARDVLEELREAVGEA